MKTEIVTDEEIKTLKAALEIARRVKNGGNKGNVPVGMQSLDVTSAIGRFLQKLKEAE